VYTYASTAVIRSPTIQSSMPWLKPHEPLGRTLATPTMGNATRRRWTAEQKLSIVREGREVCRLRSDAGE
jgi:hypothetical protein